VNDELSLNRQPGTGLVLHLPNITYVDTQPWSVDVGLHHEDVLALRDFLNAEFPPEGDVPADRFAHMVCDREGHTIPHSRCCPDRT
jgi:hypothetical protein